MQGPHTSGEGEDWHALCTDLAPKCVGEDVQFHALMCRKLLEVGSHQQIPPLASLQNTYKFEFEICWTWMGEHQRVPPLASLQGTFKIQIMLGERQQVPPLANLHSCTFFIIIYE